MKTPSAINPQTFAFAVRTLSEALPMLSLKRDEAWKAYTSANGFSAPKPHNAHLHLAALKADQALKDARAEYAHALNRAANEQANA